MVFEIPTADKLTKANALIGLPGASLRVLLYLTEVGGEVNCTYYSLASALGMTEVTAYDALKRLRRRNLVSVKHIGYDEDRYIYKVRRSPANLVESAWDDAEERIIDDGE